MLKTADHRPNRVCNIFSLERDTGACKPNSDFGSVWTVRLVRSWFRGGVFRLAPISKMFGSRRISLIFWRMSFSTFEICRLLDSRFRKLLGQLLVLKKEVIRPFVLCRSFKHARNCEVRGFAIIHPAPHRFAPILMVWQSFQAHPKPLNMNQQNN